MATSRYARTPRLDLGAQFGTSVASSAIRAGVRSGTLPYKEIVLRGAERLDTVAGQAYGDASYWWILAAASDIGWGLQVPPGTLVKIPDLALTLKIVAG